MISFFDACPIELPIVVPVKSPLDLQKKHTHTHTHTLTSLFLCRQSSISSLFIYLNSCVFVVQYDGNFPGAEREWHAWTEAYGRSGAQKLTEIQPFWRWSGMRKEVEKPQSFVKMVAGAFSRSMFSGDFTILIGISWDRNEPYDDWPSGLGHNLSEIREWTLHKVPGNKTRDIEIASLLSAMSHQDFIYRKLGFWWSFNKKTTKCLNEVWGFSQ